MALKLSGFVTALTLVLSATIGHTFFKVPDTDFGDELGADYTSYETKSLLKKFNYKTNDLNIGPYTGTWKNRKSSSGFLMFDKRKTSTDVVLRHDKYGTWMMFCSGMLKGLSFGGFSFDRNNDADYQCVMQKDDQTVRFEILPYKKPKFSLGPPKEERSVRIFLPDGSTMTAESVHDLQGTKRETKPPAGYKIKKDQRMVAGVGRYQKKQAILIAPEVKQSPEAHYAFMVGLGLQFFINNRLETDPGDR